jgi:hypothetical protein
MADSSWQFFQSESAKLKYKKSKVNGQSIKAKKISFSLETLNP